MIPVQFESAEQRPGHYRRHQCHSDEYNKQVLYDDPERQSRGNHHKLGQPSAVHHDAESYGIPPSQLRQPGDQGCGAYLAHNGCHDHQPAHEEVLWVSQETDLHVKADHCEE